MQPPRFLPTPASGSRPERGRQAAPEKSAVTTTAGNTQPRRPAGQERTRHVLLRDDLGRLTLRRLRPWHRLLARCAAARLDRELAAGTAPESSVGLAARAMALTSAKVRRELAASVQRILAAADARPVQPRLHVGYSARAPGVHWRSTALQAEPAGGRPRPACSGDEYQV